MKLDTNKLYVVYEPLEHSEMADVFDGRPDSLEGLLRQAKSGLTGDMIHSIYTTEEEARRTATHLMRGRSYAVFTSDVKAANKYRVDKSPQVYATREEAEQALKRFLKKGWKRSELKIMKY